MVDGHSSTGTLLKMDIWFQSNAHHIWQRPKVWVVDNIKIANLFQEFKKVILSEEHMENQVKRKWWKKFLETES